MEFLNNSTVIWSFFYLEPRLLMYHLISTVYHPFRWLLIFHKNSNWKNSWHCLIAKLMLPNEVKRLEKTDQKTPHESTWIPGAEYLVFVSSRSLKMREKYTNWDYLVCIFFEGRAIYVYFYRRKYFLRVSKGGSALKKYTNRDQLSCLSLLIFLSVWGNETKTKYSAPQSCGPWSCWLEPGQKAKLWYGGRPIFEVSRWFLEKSLSFLRRNLSFKCAQICC